MRYRINEDLYELKQATLQALLELFNAKTSISIDAEDEAMDAVDEWLSIGHEIMQHNYPWLTEDMEEVKDFRAAEMYVNAFRYSIFRN